MQLGDFTEEKLGFHELREYLESRTHSPEGKQHCFELKPSTDAALLRQELLRVNELKSLIETGNDFDNALPYSVSSLLDRCRIAGNWLNAEDLLRLLKWLRLVRGTLRKIQEHKEKSPALWSLVSNAEFNPKLIHAIEAVLDDTGAVKDGASPLLRQLRGEQARVSADLRKILNKLLRHARSEGWAGDSEITMRNDRLVIPLSSDFKGRIPGFVQDVSQSGQTIFLEPAESLEMNNQLRRLQMQERNEIVRILTEVTAKAGEEAETLTHFVWVIGRLDFIHAKALLAVKLNGTLPYLRKPQEPGLLLLKGYHPLLLLKKEGKRDNIIPLTLDFNPKRRIILISGPNAGGKSVALKTVGLLQLMVQCGLLIPAAEGSEFSICTKLYADIGDEQSIQNDLSTYTSHLKNMRVMEQELDSKSLFLIDEFGAGTDPRLGGAIAEAFLEKFLASGAWGVITTHYGNLKQFADTNEGIVNAAMQFDPENLAPTYHIEVGLPGRSYAFEIARKVGVSEELIARAKEKVDQREVYAEELLLTLEAQKAELDRLLESNKKGNEELKHLLEKNKEVSAQLREKRSLIIKEAREQAQALIMKANARIEKTIKEIKENQAEKEATRNLRKELSEIAAVEDLPEPPELIPEEELERSIELPDEPVAVGDWVKLKEGDTYGYVEDLQGKRAVMVVGQMRMTVNLKSVVKIEPPRPEVQSKSSATEVVRNIRENVSAEIDLQGMRVEEALITLGKFMDDATVAGLPELRILHGKGTGALRISIRDFLRKYPQVMSLSDAHEDFGGAGWTIVQLKHG